MNCSHPETTVTLYAGTAMKHCLVCGDFFRWEPAPLAPVEPRRDWGRAAYVLSAVIAVGVFWGGLLWVAL